MIPHFNFNKNKEEENKEAIQTNITNRDINGVNNNNNNNNDNNKNLSQADFLQIYTNIFDLNLIRCITCSRNITNSVVIFKIDSKNSHDLQSNDNLSIYCLDCLLKVKDNGGYYYILNNLDSNTFIKEWTLKEELLLIKGLIKF